MRGSCRRSTMRRWVRTASTVSRWKQRVRVQLDRVSRFPGAVIRGNLAFLLGPNAWLAFPPCRAWAAADRATGDVHALVPTRPPGRAGYQYARLWRPGEDSGSVTLPTWPAEHARERTRPLDGDATRMRNPHGPQTRNHSPTGSDEYQPRNGRSHGRQLLQQTPLQRHGQPNQSS